MQQDIWYYAQDNQRQGPVTLEELRSLCGSGRVGRGDLVWTVGMELWQTAGEAAPLADMFTSPAAASTPAPTLPPAPGAWQGVQTDPFQPLPPPSSGYPAGYSQPLGYETQGTVLAGFWLRFAAYLIDYLITGFAGCIVGGVFGAVIGAVAALQGQSTADIEPLLSCGGGMLGLAIGWLYSAMMECSSTQATLGKMALGLKVTDMDGRRLTFGRASGRFFGKIISTLIFCIGFLMAGWTEKKQALHDMMAGTLVVRK